MRPVRLVISVVAAAALVPLSASAAFAAPPANDTPSGAIALTLGNTVKEDTSQATTGRQDAKLNQFCGAPFTNASVWYTYTPATNGSFIVDMTQSDYSGGFMVFQGAPSGRSMLACGPDSVGVDAVKGTTYTIMVFSATKVNGGNLVLSLTKGPPPPRVKVNVASTGIAYRKGNARVSGTFSCKNAEFVDLEGQLTQIWKRVKITGFFEKFVRQAKCDGAVHPWTAVVDSDNGLFAVGDATAETDTTACGQIDCVGADETQSITLGKPGGLTGGAASATLGACSSRWAAGSMSAGSIGAKPCLPAGHPVSASGSVVPWLIARS